MIKGEENDDQIGEIEERESISYQNSNFQTFKNTNNFPDINIVNESPKYDSNPIDSKNQKSLAYSFKQDKESSIHKINNDFDQQEYNYSKLNRAELKSEKFNSQ